MQGKIIPLEGKTELTYVTPEMAKAWLARGIVCAWKGCQAKYKGKLPSEWRMIMVFKSYDAMLSGEVDGSLCPQHIKEIRGVLAGSEVPEDGVDDGTSCVWKGCHASYESEQQHPGWRVVTVFKSDDESFDDDIEGSLCPHHVAELGKFLVAGYRLSIAAEEVNRSPN